MTIITDAKSTEESSTSAIVMSKGDLDSFKAALLHEVKSLSAGRPVSKKWLRSKQVRELLHISAGTLQNLRANGKLPYAKLGGTIFYNEEDILRILEGGTRAKK